MTPRRGLPEALRDEAAHLYWSAFGDKLGRVLGPTPRALAYLRRVIRADHVFTVIGTDGHLAGLAGFKTPAGSFAGGARSDLHAVYGAFGGRWRAALLWLLSREVDNARFLIDGICVSEGDRDRGVGTALIAALCAEAARRGYPAIRLDVVDSNVRARALYERLGFLPVRTERIGPLRWIFGFRSATTMVRPIGPDASDPDGAD